MKSKFLIFILTTSICFLIYLALNNHIEKTAKAIIDSKLGEVDGQLIVKLRENKEKQQSLLMELEKNLNKIENNEKIIQSLTNLSTYNISKVHLETGILTLSNRTQPNLSSPNGCEANRGLVKEKVLFTKPFVVAPEILASFYLLDFADGSDHRLKLEISEVTNTSFIITYTTWCDTRISQSKAKWLAIGI